MFRNGFVKNLPVAASVAAYGSILGVLAAQKNIDWLQLLVMNLSVFAGSAQFVMVDMWIAPLPIAEITLAVMVINLRYLLIGASLHPLFQGTSLRHKMAMMHLVADENWAVTMAEYRKGNATTWFLLGGGVCVLSAWCAGTLAGHWLGAAIAHPEAYALDFVFVAVFTALTMSLWRGRTDVLPWLTAAVFSFPLTIFCPENGILSSAEWAGLWFPLFQQKAGRSNNGCGQFSVVCVHNHRNGRSSHLSAAFRGADAGRKIPEIRQVQAVHGHPSGNHPSVSDCSGHGDSGNRGMCGCIVHSALRVQNKKRVCVHASGRCHCGGIPAVFLRRHHCHKRQIIKIYKIWQLSKSCQICQPF
ncbi:MAG: AzlC family ABC transporter permease [Desulfobacterales bacterium]